LESISSQSFSDFEVCVSDDNSNDGRTAEIVNYLRSSGLDYAFAQNATNIRYDGNLRAAISLSSGRYCLLMGNDDCFANDRALDEIHEEITNHENVGVFIANFADYETRVVTKRVLHTWLYVGSPRVAASHFRNMAFVSGLVLVREKAMEHSTDKWDGSEMYQMFIGCRILAQGFNLLESELVPVLKDIRISGEEVDRAITRPRVSPCPIVERRMPLASLGRVVCGAIEPFLRPGDRAIPVLVFAQIMVFNYGYWILEYRRVQSWRFAAGLCLGLRPRNSLSGVAMPMFAKVSLMWLYCLVALIGLTTPLWLFDKLYDSLYHMAKSVVSRRVE
jgi:glycosyltransferase involved in cell wall biosynthesis